MARQTFTSGQVLTALQVSQLQANAGYNIDFNPQIGTTYTLAATDGGKLISLSNGSKEQILYYQDTMLGDYYTPEEMRVYLAGAGDARKNFKAWHIAIIGYELCLFAGNLVGDGLLILIIPPITYAAIQYVGKIKIREKYMSDPNFKYNDLYAEGFEPPARSRKMIRGALSGLAGSVTGVVLSIIKNQ